MCGSLCLALEVRVLLLMSLLNFYFQDLYFFCYLNEKNSLLNNIVAFNFFFIFIKNKTSLKGLPNRTFKIFLKKKTTLNYFSLFRWKITFYKRGPSSLSFSTNYATLQVIFSATSPYNIYNIHTFSDGNPSSSYPVENLNSDEA
jgi:hypothetical protein